MKEIKAEIAEWIVFENGINLFGEKIQQNYRVIEMRRSEKEPFIEFTLRKFEHGERTK